MTKLTGKAVDEIMSSVLFKEGEFTDESKAVNVKGLVRNFGFHPERVAAAKPKIDELLLQLPDTFFKNKGGGWSFLNMCVDRDGHQWTGLHATMEALVCLGIAVGSVEWLLYDLADALPGGMPYVQILIDQKAEEKEAT